VFVLNEFKAEIPSTHYAVEILNTITQSNKTLIALSRNDDMFLLSLRNVPNYTIVYADQLSAYDVLLNEAVLFTTGSLTEFLEFRAPGDYEIKIDESLDDETKDEVAEGTAKHPKEFIEVEEEEESKPKRRARKAKTDDDATDEVDDSTSPSSSGSESSAVRPEDPEERSVAEAIADGDAKPKRTRAKKATSLVIPSDEVASGDLSSDEIDQDSQASQPVATGNDKSDDKPKARKPRKTKAGAGVSSEATLKADAEASDATSSEDADAKPKRTRKPKADSTSPSSSGSASSAVRPEDPESENSVSGANSDNASEAEPSGANSDVVKEEQDV
jgi:hypothetical protein